MHFKTVLLVIALSVAVASAVSCSNDNFSSTATLDDVVHTCQSDTAGITTYTYTLNHNHGTDVDNFVLCTPSSWNSAMILQVDIEPQGQCTSNGQIQLDGATGQTGLKFVCNNWNGASSVTVSVTANGLFSTLQGTTIYSTAGNQCSSEIVSGGGWGC